MRFSDCLSAKPKTFIYDRTQLNWRDRPCDPSCHVSHQPPTARRARGTLREPGRSSRPDGRRLWVDGAGVPPSPSPAFTTETEQ
jgi:hypothetical protein